MAKTPPKKVPPERGGNPPVSRRGPSVTNRSKEIQKLKQALKKNPADEEAFVQLWDAFLESESWEAMIELLRNKVEVLTDEREKIRALIKLGSLYDEKLGDARRAIDAFQQVLVLDRGNRRALWALGVLYHDLEDWEKVIETYLLRISVADNPEEKLALRTQLAQIYEQRLQQEDQALMEYIRAARLAPQNVRILLHMEKLATHTESFHELLAIYEDVVERIERVELQIALFLKLARLYNEQFKDKDKANEYYRRALSLSGGDPEKLFSISSIYGEEEEWEELIATYTQLIALAAEPQVKSRLRREIARLYNDGLRDPASAFFELVRVARYEPSFPGLIDDLAELGAACDKHLELAAVLEDVGERLPDPESRARLYTRLARLHLGELHNADLAKIAIAKALDLAPANVDAQLVRFDLLEATKGFEALALALEAFLSRPDLPEEVAKEQRKRLARLYEQKLGNRERAVELFRQNLREPLADGSPAPGQREEILEQLYRRQGTWEELINLLTNRMTAAADPETLGNIALEIADIREKHLDQSDRAFFELVRAAKQAVGHERLLDELFRLARSAGFVTEVLAVAEDLLTTMSDSAAARLHARVGQLLESDGKLNEALDRFQRALSLDPLEASAFQAMRAHVVSAGDWGQVVELDLQRASRLTDRDEKTELLLGAAELIEEKLGNDGRAADVYDRVLGLDPGSTVAHKAIHRLRGEAGRIAKFDPDITEPSRLKHTGAPAATKPSQQGSAPDSAGIPHQQSLGIVEDRGEGVAGTPPLAPRPDEEATGPVPNPPELSKETPKEDVAVIFSPAPEREVTVPDRKPAVAVTMQAEQAVVVSPRPVQPPPLPHEIPELAPAGIEEEDREPTLVQRAPPALPGKRGKPQEPKPEAATTTAGEAEEEKEPTLVTAAPQPTTPQQVVDAGEEILEGDFESLEEEFAQATQEAAVPAVEPVEKPAPQPAESIAPAAVPVSAPAPAAASEPLPPEPPSAEKQPSKASGEPEPDQGIDTTSMVEEPNQRGQELDPKTALWSLVRADPADMASWEKLTALLKEEGGPGAAFAALEDGCSLAKSDEQRANFFRRMSQLAQTTDLRLRLGKLLEDCGRSEDAESSYRTVLRSEPANEAALDGLMRLYQARSALDRYDAILTRALKGVKEPKGRRAVQFRRAVLRAEKLDRVKDALVDLDQLIESDPNDIDVLTYQENLLEQTGQHDALVKAYERHLKHVGSGGERVDLLTAMAILYENRLDNLEQAASYYRAALTEDPTHLGALESLVSLLEKRRDWLGAIEVLKTATEAIQDPTLRNQMHQRRGKILEEQMLRPEEAEEAYRHAIDGDVPSVEALTALRGMARRRGDWVEVIRFGNLLLRQQEKPAERAQLLVELARAWRDKLDNEEKALECYEEACQLDPDNLEATRVVAELRLKSRRHEEAHGLLVRLAERGARGEMEEEELAAVYLKIAQSSEALERPADAAAAFEQALKLTPTDQQVLTQYGYHLARRGNWERAVQIYQDILDRHHQRLNPTDVADMHCLIAQGLLKLSRTEDAAAHYRQALRANPKHLPALRASIEMSQQLQRFDETVTLLKRLHELSGSPAARFKLSVQVGDVLSDALERPADAAAAYREALKDEPNNLEILEKLRRVLVRTEAFAEAVEILERLAHLAPADRQRARYLRIAADISGERLDDDRRALAFYLRALKLAPLDQRAFTTAVKILSRLRDWPQLAALYDELLRRLPPPIAGQEDQRLPILTELIELYRYRLNEPKKAIAACEQLLAIDRNNIKVREDLARLSESEGRLGQAVAMHRSLIADSPFSVDSYHALRRIYEQQGDRDRTLCLAATLAFLDEANEDEQRLLREYRHALPLPPGRRLDEELYGKLLLYKSAGGLLGEMFSFAADFCRTLFAVDHKEFKLKPREAINLNDRSIKLVELINEALNFLGLPPPEVYAKGIFVKGIMAVNTSPVAVLYSEDTLRKATIPEMRFMVGRAIAFTRPENLLAATLTAKQLRVLLEGMVELVLPGGPIHPVAEEIASLAMKLNKLIPSRKHERLTHLASQYREQAEDLSIRDWLEGIEHTCNRVGLALCGDLDAAVQVLKTARVVSPSGSSRSLIRELIFYSISEEYFGLRKTLNAAIA